MSVAHFETASGTLGLGVGRPGEEAPTHARVQGLLQQVLEAGGIHRWVLVLDIDLDSDDGCALLLLSGLQSLQHHTEHRRVPFAYSSSAGSWNCGIDSRASPRLPALHPSQGKALTKNWLPASLAASLQALH